MGLGLHPALPGLRGVGHRDGAGIVPETQTPKPSPAAGQRDYPGAQGGGAGSSSRLTPALLSLPQDFRAGHWIFHPVLPDDLPGRAVLSQAPGGLPLHHPHRR